MSTRQIIIVLVTAAGSLVEINSYNRFDLPLGWLVDHGQSLERRVVRVVIQRRPRLQIECCALSSSERVSAATTRSGSGVKLLEDTSAVILGFMPRIHLSETAHACCRMDPRDKPEDDYCAGCRILRDRRPASSAIPHPFDTRRHRFQSSNSLGDCLAIDHKPCSKIVHPSD